MGLWSPFILGNFWGTRRQFFNPFGHIWGYQRHFISSGYFWDTQGVLWGPPQPADDDSGSGEDETSVSPDSEVSDATTVSPDSEVPDETTVSPGGNTSQPADDGFGEESSLTTTAPTGNDVEDGSGLMTYTTTIIPEEARHQGGGPGLEGDGVTTIPTDAFKLAAEQP